MSLLLDFIIVGLSIGVVYGVVALGISLIYSGLDIVHFAHGEVYMIGAFIGIAIVNITGVPYFGALVGAMVVTGIVGVVIERVFYRRLTRGGGGYTVAGMGMIICGFGMSVALQNVAYLIWGAAPHPYPLIHPLILLSNDTKDSLEYSLLHKHLQKPLHQWTDSLIRPVGNMVIQHQPLTKQRVRTIFHRVRL